MSEVVKVGDRVRVTYEGRVTEADGSVRVRTPDDALVWAPADATVEVLNRADDPADDPVGTVRRSPTGKVAVKLDEDEMSWIVDSDWERNDRVAGWPIIGAVPGTPAAVKPEPRVFYRGDLQPSSCVAVVGRSGELLQFAALHPWEKGVPRWWHVNRELQHTWGSWRYWLDKLGPLTEVCE